MKKSNALIMFLCVTLCFSIGLFSFLPTPKAYAEEKENYFTSAEYTDNDELLRSDGTSSFKDIQMFADEVPAHFDFV